MAVATLLVDQAVGKPRTTDGLVSFDLGLADRLDVELDPNIFHLERFTPGAPILGFSARAGAPRRSKQPVFHMLRTRPLKQFVTLGAAYTNVATTVTLASADDGDIIQPGHHLLNVLTREILRVVSKAGAVVTVERARGSVQAAASSGTSDTLLNLQHRGAEGDELYDEISYFPESYFNYVGESQRTWKVSQYEDASDKRGLSQRRRLRSQHTEEHRMTIEKAYLFDQRTKFVESVNNRVVRVPNGLDAICSENETDFAGTITEQKILAAAETLARYGPSSRMVMCSPRFFRKVGELFLDRQRWSKDTITMAGVNVVRYQANNLTLNFFMHPLFFDDPTPTAQANALNGTAYVVDFNTLRTRTLGGSKGGYFRMNLNVELSRGYRFLQDQIVTNFGLEWRFAEFNGRWLNPGT